MKFWENDDIMLVATGIPGIHALSKNPKTGPMAQAWVLAKKDYTDDNMAWQKKACGACPLAPYNTGGCYVLPFHAPRSVHRTYLNKPVSPIEAVSFPLGLRLTAFGELPLVPFDICEALLKRAAFHTGYTHMWKELDSKQWGFLMASVHSEEEMEEANDLGWTAFVTSPTKPDSAMTCINAVSNKSCFECGLCDGNASPHKKNIWIKPHGARKSKVIEVSNTYTF